MMRNENMIESQKPQCVQTSVICSALSTDEWRRLAGRIDTGFFDSDETFTAERKNGYYYLNTNRCDDVLLVKVYFTSGKSGIDKITALGEYTEGWSELHKETYKSVENFLNSLVV